MRECSMFKVGIVYRDGRKEITHLSHRSIDWVIRVIKSNNEQGHRVLVLVKE